MTKTIFIKTLCIASLLMNGLTRADNVTFVLQNGTNGYTGCTDTYGEYGNGATGMLDGYKERLAVGSNYCIV